MNFLNYYHNLAYNTTMEKIAEPVENYNYNYRGLRRQLSDQPIAFPTAYLNSTRRNKNKLVSRFASDMDKEVNEVAQDAPWDGDVASLVGGGSLGALGGGLGYGLAKNKWLGAGLSAGTGALLGALLGRNVSKERTGRIEDAKKIKDLDLQKRKEVLKYLAGQALEDTREHARARQMDRNYYI